MKRMIQGEAFIRKATNCSFIIRKNRISNNVSTF